ncbi:sensor domain-containing diguanylate cyclase [Lactobacillus delbrueckii]|uniref:sensor domain-containing diguanylate cyclase n=1 Tax=Lactobacillus delbrueckii TaxID=1584 RepID=UPI0027ED0F0E|nr:GGDEF domain-containing phosphodiesterase [Lactobacillus delbrueckii]MDQ7161010.1 GGDEF domain-containing phosphodiesterase [Lactobacillus delbrueckii subsp. lactis]MDQ7177525.1 GGDEF domain-containing phosphodiesterase [Lactobacillus delbrueckii subsp. lactis]
MLGYVELMNQCMDRAMQDGDPSDEIMIFLSEIGEELKASRAYIFQLNEKQLYDNTYEWCAPGVASERATLQDMPRGDLGSPFARAFRENSGYYISDMAAFKETDPMLYEVFSRQELSSLVLCPFYFETDLVGFVGVDEPKDMSLALPVMQIASSHMSGLLQKSFYVEKGASADSVTNLCSVTAFRHHVAYELAEIKANPGLKLDLVHFDISNFKFFNKEHGLKAGDELLKRLAQVISQEVGSPWLVRSVADHFYALIPDSKVDQAIRNVHDAIIRDEAFGASIRAGIYPLSASDQQVSFAMDRARIAANNAVGNYRNYYCRYEEKMEADLTLANYLLSHIDEAVAKGWIKVYYQPIVDTFSSKISTYEALARWIDPKYGFLNPGEFIEVLERGHLIHKLDLHILDLVCQDLEEAMQKGETYPMVSVNLSRYDLELPDLHERINNILASHGVKSSQIRIEITESALLSNTEAVIKEHISRFHEDGYQVWLDDFGSGFSSLNSLQNFDFDLLKIDMAFLRHANEKTPTILMDVIDMAKRLGIETLSEGVETKDEYDFLHSIGCVLAQGFYFSQPLPKAKITAKRKERGLEFESPAEHALYQKIGQVNVLNALYPFSGSNHQELAETVPVMVFLDKGGDLEPIYSNKVAQNWCQSLRLRGAGFEFDCRREFLTLVKQLGETAAGEIIEENFRIKDYAGRLRLQLVAEMPGQRAYVINTNMV